MPNSIIAQDTGDTSTAKFYSSLDRLMGASIGVIAIRTRELERAKLYLHQWASMRNMDYRVWDIIGGFGEYKRIAISEVEGQEIPEITINPDEVDSYLRPTKMMENTRSPIDALEVFRIREERKENRINNFCGVFMGVISEILQDPVVQQHLRDHVHRAYQNSDRIYLLLAPGVTIPDTLASDIEVIDLPTPSFSELHDSLIETEESIPPNFNYKPTNDERNLIVQNSIGMTLQEFENALALGIVDISTRLRKKPGSDNVITAKDFIAVVRQRKLEILKNTQILELMPEASIKDIGGLDLLKAAMELQKPSFGVEARAFGIKPARGFIVVGPPGTGKSLVCKSVSYVLGVPAIKFDVSSVYNSLVGSSEQRMRSALRMVEEMAPNILFIDEIEKIFGSTGGGDGGVSQRILGTFLTWLQDRQDKEIPVMVIASANDVTKIPPELMRKGRFDAIWGLGFPSLSERALIFKIHVEKRGHSLDKADYKKLALATNTFVGSEIEAAVEEALTLDFAAGNEGLTLGSIEACINKLVPQAKAFPKRIEDMREWCDQNARPASSSATLDSDEAPIVDNGGETMLRVKRPIKLKRSSNN